MTKINAAIETVKEAEEALVEARAELAEAIKAEFPIGTKVYFNAGRGEASAPVIAHAGENLFLDTISGKKLHYSEARLEPKPKD